MFIVLVSLEPSAHIFQDIARTMKFKSMAKDLKGCVKEILGTAFSVGCQVDGRSPKEISDDIEAGEIESKSRSASLAHQQRLTVHTVPEE
jgi:large subunit ribosomal protein L12e